MEALFKEGHVCVIWLIFLFFPSFCVKSSIKYEPSITHVKIDAGRFVVISVCFWANDLRLYASPSWIRRSSLGSFLRCQPLADKGSVFPGDAGPAGGWKMWGLLGLCRLLVGWLWTGHSFLHSSNTLWTIYQVLRARLAARATEMNNLVSLFLGELNV